MGFNHRLGQSMGGSLAALLLAVMPGMAAELDDWSFDPGRSELTFSLPDTVFPEFFLLAEPARLVLDLPDTEIGSVDPDQFYGGAVQSIRVAQFAPDQVRIVIELAPGIVLEPNQADIQFDDGDDGERHWRFKPLLAGDAIATASNSEETQHGTISLSAVNLQASTVRQTALPIDPYAPDPSTAVISVPPLTALAANETPPAEARITTVPVPDLPAMTVPQLESAGVGVVEQSATTAVASPRSELPALEARGPAPSLVVDDPQVTAVDVVIAPEPTPLSTQPSLVIEPESESRTVVASPSPPVSAAVPQAMVQPSVVVIQPLSQNVSSSFQPISPSTIQQPAADRTIIQTDTPAPLTFGQPLPKSSI